MKLFNKILLSAAAIFAMTACGEDTPDYTKVDSKDVDFTYEVEGDEYTLDYYVVSHIQFNNTSSKSGAVTWNFGDGTTSTESNPVHKYAQAGIYKVSLTVDGVGTQTYPILIYDIAPVLSVEEQSTEIVEINSTTLSFNLELPNPEHLRVKYVWTFPEGTKDENGNPITTFTGYSDANGNVDYPGKLSFSNIGSQKIEISTWFDLDGENRRLEDSYLNVQVGCDTPAATLYYAERNGNIKALKLVDLAKLPAGTKVMPFDMGVSSGNMPMNLVYADVATKDENDVATTEGWVYILDAGKQYYYVNDEDGVLGDGYVNAMRTDGTGVNTVITNVGGAAFNDPFIGCADGEFLYYSDRNQGVSRIALTARGEVEGKNSSNQRTDYFIKNEKIPYYGGGIAYGAVTTGLCKDKSGKFWLCKNYNGPGLYRLRSSDLYQTQDEATKARLAGNFLPIILPSVKMRTFAIDEARKALYVWKLGAAVQGFYEYPLPTDDQGLEDKAFTKQLLMEADPINTTADETVNITQFAIDNETGRVYFCWRPDSGDKSGVRAGIVYYDPTSKKVVPYSESTDLGMGCCINPNKTKLF